MSFRRFIAFCIIVSFFLTTLGPLPKAHADTVLNLPAPGTMVNLSPAYEPVIIKGLTVHKDNPFLFDFIVDVGQDRMSGEPLKKEGEKLIKYFLASLAIPDKDLWVNLSPYEKNRMIPEALGQTDMGRDLLEQDYILKQITASLIYPEKQLGKTFWDKVYAKAQQMYGTTQVPVNTFNKVWIMADKAEVFEHNQTAFVVGSHLKVMLEEDYLALQKHSVASPLAPGNDTHSIGANIVRAIILPELEKEVNTGKNFANLRQILNSLILANWYKKNLKQALLNQVYTNQSKVKGIDLNDPTIKQQIYEQYLKAYKKGVFNFIKEDVTAQGNPIPRKYFSGGFGEAREVVDPAVTSDPAALARALPDRTMMDFATLASTQPTNPDAAMGSPLVADKAMFTRRQVIQGTGYAVAAATASLSGIKPAGAKGLLKVIRGPKENNVIFMEHENNAPPPLVLPLLENTIKGPQEYLPDERFWGIFVKSVLKSARPFLPAYRQEVKVLREIISKTNIRRIGLGISEERLQNLFFFIGKMNEFRKFLKSKGTQGVDKIIDDINLSVAGPAIWLAISEPEMGIELVALESSSKIDQLQPRYAEPNKKFVQIQREKEEKFRVRVIGGRIAGQKGNFLALLDKNTIERVIKELPPKIGILKVDAAMWAKLDSIDREDRKKILGKLKLEIHGHRGFNGETAIHVQMDISGISYVKVVPMLQDFVRRLNQQNNDGQWELEDIFSLGVYGLKKNSAISEDDRTKMLDVITSMDTAMTAADKAAVAKPDAAMLSNDGRYALMRLNPPWTASSIQETIVEISKQIAVIERQLNGEGMQARTARHIYENSGAMKMQLKWMRTDLQMLETADRVLTEINRMQQKKERLGRSEIWEVVKDVFPIKQGLTKADETAINEYKSGSRSLDVLLGSLEAKLTLPAYFVNSTKKIKALAAYIELISGYGDSLEGFLRVLNEYLNFKESSKEDTTFMVLGTADLLKRENVKQDVEVATYLANHVLGLEAGNVIPIPADAAMISDAVKKAFDAEVEKPESSVATPEIRVLGQYTEGRHGYAFIALNKDMSRLGIGRAFGGENFYVYYNDPDTQEIRFHNVPASMMPKGWNIILDFPEKAGLENFLSSVAAKAVQASGNDAAMTANPDKEIMQRILRNNFTVISLRIIEVYWEWFRSKGLSSPLDPGRADAVHLLDLTYAEPELLQRRAQSIAYEISDLFGLNVGRKEKEDGRGYGWYAALGKNTTKSDLKAKGRAIRDWLKEQLADGAMSGSTPRTADAAMTVVNVHSPQETLAAVQERIAQGIPDGQTPSIAAMTVEQLKKGWGPVVDWWFGSLVGIGMPTIPLENFLRNPTEDTWQEFYNSVPIPGSIDDNTLLKPAEAYAFIRYVREAVGFEPKEPGWGPEAFDQAQVAQGENVRKQLSLPVNDHARNGLKADRAMVTLEEILNTKDDQRGTFLRTLTLETLNDFLQRALYVSGGNEHAGPDLWKAHWHGTLDPLIEQIKQTMDAIVNRFLVLPIEKRRAVLNTQPLGTLRVFKAILEKRNEMQSETGKLVDGFIPEVEETSLDRVSRMKTEMERDEYLRGLPRAALAALQLQGKEVIRAGFNPGNYLIHERDTGRLKPLLDKIDMLIAQKPEIEFSFNGVTQTMGQEWFDLASEFIKVNDSNKKLITILYRIFSGIVHQDVRTPEMVETIRMGNSNREFNDDLLLLEALIPLYNGANSRLARFKEALPFKSGADFNQMERSADALITETRDSILSLEKNLAKKENLKGEVKELAVLRDKLPSNTEILKAQKVTKRTINTFLQRIKPYDPYYTVVQVSISESNRDILDQRGWNLYLKIYSKPSLGGLLGMFKKFWLTRPDRVKLNDEFKSFLKGEYEKGMVEFSDAAMLGSWGKLAATLVKKLKRPDKDDGPRFEFPRHPDILTNILPKKNIIRVLELLEAVKDEKSRGSLPEKIPFAETIIRNLGAVTPRGITLKPTSTIHEKVGWFFDGDPEKFHKWRLKKIQEVQEQQGLPRDSAMAADAMTAADKAAVSQPVVDKNKVYKTSGEMVEDFRKQKGLTQEELARKLWFVRELKRGSNGVISRIEKGKVIAKESTLESIVRVLELNDVQRKELFRLWEQDKLRKAEERKNRERSELGELLRKSREELKLTMDEVAKRAKVTAATISNYENRADRIPDLGPLKRIAKVLGLEEKEVLRLRFKMIKTDGTLGGIDLNSNNIHWNIRKDGNGVELNIDPAMIERIKREGIDSLSPVIFRITPVTSIWRLAGLQAPAQAERLAGV